MSGVLTATLNRASERVSFWPGWKHQIGHAFLEQMRESSNIILERMEYVRLHGEQ
jgi:hypothetical protein